MNINYLRLFLKGGKIHLKDFLSQDNLNYKEKKIANIIMPAMTPRITPHMAPGIILFVMIKSISFFKLISIV